MTANLVSIRLPYDTLPIRPNLRLHWATKARTTRQIRDAAAILGRIAWKRAPIDYPVIVTLVWEVADRRVRDAGAGAMTAKAAVDGLVDAGVLARDSHDVVTEERYRVEVGARKGVRLEICPAADATMPIPGAQPAGRAISGRKTGNAPPDPSTGLSDARPRDGAA